jgi:hypothetical protein
METETKRAISQTLREMSDAIAQLAALIDMDGQEGYSPAHARLPWSERVLRQSLIIQDIVNEGGSVTRDRWVEIAGRYGYAGRGLAGFFRGGSGSQGLLEMKKTGRVVVTKHGRERLAQNLGRVTEAREAENSH